MNQYELFFHHSSDMLFIMNEQGDILDANESLKKRFKSANFYTEFNKIEEKIKFLTIIAQHKNQRAISLTINDSPYLFDIHFSGSQIFLTAHDNSEYVKQNEILKYTTKTAGIAYWDWNPKTNYLEFDKEWFEQIDILDKSSTNLNDWMEALHPDDVHLVSQKIKDHLEGKTEIFEVLMRLKSLKGSYKYVLAKGKIIEWDENHEPTKFCGVHVDLSEMMELKQELETQKILVNTTSQLASLGEMAGNIAHEINNPLQILSFINENLKNSIEEYHDREKYLSDCLEIDATLARIDRIIKGMKTLCRNSDLYETKTFSLTNTLDQTLNICRENLKNHGIELFLDFDQSRPYPITGNEGQIAQVFLNLINNARDAIVYLPKKWIRINIKVVNESTELSFIDSGLGIPSEISEKLMTPFFTTKPLGKGTGLGLSISKKIIEAHGGQIFIDHSNPNTCFKIVIPNS